MGGAAPGGDRPRRAGEATRPGIRQEERFVSQKVLLVVHSESASQTAREDVKGTVRSKGGRRRTGSSDRDQTLRIPVKPC